MTSPADKPSATPRFAVAALIMAAVLVIGAGALLAIAWRGTPGNNSLLSAAIGGPFHLTDQNGRPFTDADLKGKWHLVFFGYTHCPDVCPTTLNELSLALEKLDKKQRGVVGIVFITVDPERDTADVLRSYVQSFDGPIVALTGTPDEVKQAAKNYRVYYAKHERPDGGYDMDHSAVIYLMDPQGRLTGTLTPDSAADVVAVRLQKLLS